MNIWGGQRLVLERRRMLEKLWSVGILSAPLRLMHLESQPLRSWPWRSLRRMRPRINHLAMKLYSCWLSWKYGAPFPCCCNLANFCNSNHVLIDSTLAQLFYFNSSFDNSVNSAMIETLAFELLYPWKFWALTFQLFIFLPATNSSFWTLIIIWK